MWRLALGLVRNDAAEHRWRRLALPLSAFLFMLLLLVAASVFVMTVREDGRASARAALLSTEPAPTDLLMVPRQDTWEDRTIAVVWLEPVDDTDPVLPPGVIEPPARGQAVVSPALDEVVSDHPRLAARYPNRVVLDPVGLRSGGELIAYVRMPADHQLSAEQAHRVENGTIVGEGPAFRVSEFGGSEDAVGFFPIGEPGGEVSAGAVVTGLLVVLVVPGLILLAVGCAAASELRDRRFELLRAIGAGPRPVMALAVLETLLLAVPGLGVGAGLWGAVGGRLGSVPLVGHEVVTGDLGLDWWLLLAMLMMATVLTAVVAVAVTAAGGHRQTTPRPTRRRARFTVLRVVPLAGAVAAFTYGRSYGGSMAEDYYLVGVACAVIGTVLIMPWILVAAGGLLSRLRPVTAMLVGRSMQWDPAGAARPFAAAAALLVLVLTSAGYIALGRTSDDVRPPASDVQAMAVEWQDPQPGDLAQFRDAVGTGLTAPLSEGELHRHTSGGDHHHDTGTLSIGARCADIARYVPAASCDESSPLDIPPAVERTLAERLAPFAHGPISTVQLVPSEELDGAGTLLVLDTATAEAFDARVRTAAMAVLAVPNLHGWQPAGKSESPLVRWIIAGAVAAAASLTLACLLALTNRMLIARHHHRRLLHVGISTRRLTALAAGGFLLPYLVVAATSLIIGVVACTLLVTPVTTVPWATVRAAVVLIATAGVGGVIGVATLSAKNLMRERE